MQLALGVRVQVTPLVAVPGPDALGLAARRTGAAAAAFDEPKAGAPRPLRILILGGTGFTGPHQVRYALARGHKLTLFNRGRRPQQWPAPVEELVGDRNTGDLKALAGREWDVCIDNPTSLPFWVRDAGQVLAGKVGQYVFISTLSVYASDKEPGQDETAPLAQYQGGDAMKETQQTLRANLEGLYGPLKALSEREAEKWFPGRTTVIRPGLIVGPGDESDRFSYWPVRLDRGGDALAPGDGSDPVQFVDARDLAEWTVRVAEARSLGTFNAMGPAERLTSDAKVIRFDGLPSPDGQWIAFADKDYQLWMFNAAKKALSRIGVSDVTMFGDLAWSPDSGWLACVEGA